MFEGYTGIPVGQEQWMNDLIWGIVFLLFISFSFIFYYYSPVFLRTLKDIVQVKHRQSLFEVGQGSKGDERVFHAFMTFQTLLLSTLFLFIWYKKAEGATEFDSVKTALYAGSLFLLLLLYYYFKRGIYALLGWTFFEKESYRLWQVGYQASLDLLGVLFYIPLLWILFIDTDPIYPFGLFSAFYLLSRCVIIYKTIRIFQIKKGDYLFLFLYLCAQEIAPLFLFINGAVLLYNFIALSTLWR
ncbi:hypothetical protein M2480_001338 [Parabacteroides sp. PFB2-12]|uniref:DUF4271 domain-containing protein n=1 Tax=unclassified Parabacteroides TaxID=2649774 RepID=UPI002474EA7D|nr:MULTISPECIES: DUF4271 domain-containing protein [unclassified Parabacteroides]MDH6343349.1 hypothetical protein [Parabacteroides sp. PM6-13]MDH6390365.1 hypothetical protein [Parabacteroides sp. PFB2-12]MDL2310032.1 DUF4271 domain-containing protein [Parabacteroides sp. OttesenSCG-928-B22]